MQLGQIDRNQAAVQPKRPTAQPPAMVAVFVGDEFYFGHITDKVAGGLYAIDAEIDGTEVFLGVFRHDEILDPNTIRRTLAAG